jgi:ferredoxin-type protein NapH
MTCEAKHPASHSKSAAGGKAISLTVLPSSGGAGKGKAGSRAAPRSTMGKKRAIVLITIQVLMIIHVAHWWLTGTSISPIEPSDSMATFKDGIINAGAVVFGLGLLSTLVLGRWFCGWGCHIIMLQDFCTWLMEKCGIRPKPFRSRLLLFVPLLMAIYMFLWPVFYRLAVAPYTRPDLAWSGFTTRFVVQDYMAGFPGILTAIPFFLVCAFLTVYLLGSKGYCTYACPYGGFFAPLDEFAIGRIRVNDQCEHCGHCTAVCTSNVRVHEEVRDFGMVVDPGCMKCMDCVSACPNEALSFGFGAPAVLAAPRPGMTPVPRSYDLTLREEIGFAIVAALTFLATRGSFGFVLPLLFSSGVVACVTYITYKAWRVLRERNEHFHRLQLRRDGRVTGAGAAWVAGACLLLGVTLHSATMNGLGFLAGWFDDRVQALPEVVFSENPVALEPKVAVHAERALSLYGTISTLGQGGFGIFPPVQPLIDQRRAWLQSTLGRFDEAERTLRAMIDREGLNESSAAAIGRVLRGQRKIDDARAWYIKTIEAQPGWVQLQDEYVQWLVDLGEDANAITVARNNLIRARAEGASADHELFLMRRLSLLLVEKGFGDEISEGVQLTERTLEIAPGNAFAYRALAIGYARLERMEEAEKALRKSIELAPNEWRLRQSLGEMLMGIGREAEGAEMIKDATKLRGGKR